MEPAGKVAEKDPEGAPEVPATRATPPVPAGAATYDATRPPERAPLDDMRGACADTNVETDPATGDSLALLPDATYLVTLLREGSDWRLAAAALCGELALAFSLDPDAVTLVGDLSVSWRDRVKAYQEQEKRLRAAAEAAAALEIAAAGLAFGSLPPSRGDLSAACGEYRGGPYSVDPWTLAPIADAAHLAYVGYCRPPRSGGR